MKIGMLNWPITEVKLDEIGGMERVAFYEMKYLKKHDIDVTFYVKKLNGEHRNIKEIKDFQLFRRFTFILYYLLFYLRNLDKDIFHSMNAPIIAVFAPQKTLIHLHNLLKINLYRAATKRFHKAYYAFNSEFMMKKFLKEYPLIPKENCFVLHNGVDISKFCPLKDKKRNKNIRLFYFSQWNEKKGIFVLLKAAELLVNKRNDWEIVLGGSPFLWRSKKDLQEGENIEKKVKSIARNLKNVTIMGKIDHDKLPHILKNMDVAIIPSVWDEPFGLNVIEAMAAGLPVIASRTGGIPEAIEDKKNGILVERNNPEQLARAIENLLDNPSLIKEYGERGRARVEESFSWDIHIKKLINIYNHILEHKK